MKSSLYRVAAVMAAILLVASFMFACAPAAPVTDPVEETPSPVEATAEPTVEPTAEPTEEPAATEAPVEFTTELDIAELEARMYAYFEMMQTGDFPSIVADFSDSLAAQLDEAGLSSAWKSVTANRGAFTANKEISSEITENGGVTVSLVSGFEKRGMDTKFTFDPEGKITAIWFYDETIKEDDSGEKLTDAQFKEFLQKHVDNMMNDDFEAVGADFSNALMAQLSVDDLAKSWKDVAAGLGTFEKHVSSQVTHLGENQNEVVLISKFSTQALKTVFVCRDNGKITEIWFYYI